MLENFLHNPSILGIKCETEAEGLTYDEIFFLRTITSKYNVPMHLKIGGVEALSDIIKSYEIGVDGLIAPMVESSFAAHKFITSLRSIYQDKKIYTTINIETIQAIENLSSILKIVKNDIDCITIGRSDLSASYFDPEITPDSPFIFERVKDILKMAKDYGLSVGLGGKLSVNTLKVIQNDIFLFENLDKIETRKVMLPTAISNEIIPAVHEWEKQFILRQQHISECKIKKDLDRLQNLKALYE